MPKSPMVNISVPDGQFSPTALETGNAYTGGGLTRSKSRLVKPERSLSTRRRPLVARAETRVHENFARTGMEKLGYLDSMPRPDRAELTTTTSGSDSGQFDPWQWFVNAVTCCCLPVCLRGIGKMYDPLVQHAWREKIALIVVILACCLALAFVTFGLQAAICDPRVDRFPLSSPPDAESWAIRGDWFQADAAYMAQSHPASAAVVAGMRQQGQVDVTPLFRNSIGTPTCDQFSGTDSSATPPATSCTMNGVTYCHKLTYEEVFTRAISGYSVSFEWEQIRDTGSNKLLVFNGIVLDVQQYLQDNATSFLGDQVQMLVTSNLGQDATLPMMRSAEARDRVQCLVERYRVGYLSKETRGCFAAQVINTVTLVVILSLILTRFIMALIYTWVVAPRLSRAPTGQPYLPPGVVANKSGTARKSRGSLQFGGGPSSVIAPPPNRQPSAIEQSRRNSVQPLTSFIAGAAAAAGNSEMYATYLMYLVTCYSEDEAGLRTTLESLAETDYPDRHKIIFMVADGIVTGGGQSQSTPDICRSLINVAAWSQDPQPMSYIAVADGAKQHNMAQVYAGTFDHNGHSVPTVLVVKCGTPAEKSDGKPGNRGKRDSQIILMNFLSKVMFNDRMTPLEYDLFTKIAKVASVSPDRYEIVLMVDADTKVMPDSVPMMVNAMKNDIGIMGLCGETRIANKKDSWVTAIQVYEYFISHHLAKTFESMFGGVTCLPGCFSAYRIKSPKGPTNNLWVPILANPDIILEYSTQTLHTKNLLLLGEDRFLTTLMLKTFPRRQMMFLPQACCKTVVPDTFSVLLSQRRRWINSTIHNLMELVLVKDLCGTFCFSMQFVVALELFGTVVLPAAIIFTMILLYTVSTPASSFVRDSLQPLLLLCLVLFLPALLILFTAGRRWVYVAWMGVYMLALPVWNFVLPVYAFWHFDDFSWGKTRVVDSDDPTDKSGHGGGHGSGGKKADVFDPKEIMLKHWHEWELDMRQGGKQQVDSSKPSRLLDHKQLPAVPETPYISPPSSRPASSAMNFREERELNWAEAGFATDTPSYGNRSSRRGAPVVPPRHSRQHYANSDAESAVSAASNSGYLSDSAAYPMHRMMKPPSSVVSSPTTSPPVSPTSGQPQRTHRQYRRLPASGASGVEQVNRE